MHQKHTRPLFRAFSISRSLEPLSTGSIHPASGGRTRRLLLCVATSVVWVRSFWRWDLVELIHNEHWHAYFISSASGAVDFGSSYEIPETPTISWIVDPAPTPRHATLWWFYTDFQGWAAWSIRIPYWCPF